MSKKYYSVIKCDYCGKEIKISHEKYLPFKNSPTTDIRLEIVEGCEHFVQGRLNGYASMGKDFDYMIQNRQVEYQQLEEREYKKKMKKLIENFDEDDIYNPERF